MEKSPNPMGKYLPSIVVIGLALASWKLLGGPELLEEFSKKELLDQYDFIIVGGGTSGGVIASRLAEDRKTSILLIEAGGNPENNPDIDVPIFTDRVRGTEWDWQYSTVPQKHSCKSHVNQSTIWPAGKGLGGTSNLNYMQYLRGSRHDYDEWANNGATGWSYKDVLPYFIKSEDNQNGGYVRTVFHGFGGRLPVQTVDYSAANDIMKRAFDELGVKHRDLNGRNMFGYGETQATIRRGVRFGTFRAFIKRVLHVDNLHILTHTQARKIVFEGRKAVGVEVLHNGEPRTFRVNKEIVLSAGTVGSAKLLMLSGIGPRQHLKDMKIPLVLDLPVGTNLQDHVASDGIEFFTPYKGVSITAAKAENFLQAWAYSIFGTGMKSSPRFREGTAYVKLRHQPPQYKYPLIALHIVANTQVYSAKSMNINEEVKFQTKPPQCKYPLVALHKVANTQVFSAKSMNTNEEDYDALHADPPHREGFTIFPVLLHPRSRGTVRLASNDPDDMPLIDPNYLQEDADVTYLVNAMKYARNLIKMKPLQDWNFEVNKKLLPQCARAGNWTTAYLECYQRHVTLPGFAPVGTCKMGAVGDPTAVVDPLLRVRGIKGVRVGDASVFPSAISGNTYATQIMIGEKIADMLREKDTVKSIRDYFKHLLDVKHDRIIEDEQGTHEHPPEDEEDGATDAKMSTGNHGNKKIKKAIKKPK